MKYMHLKMYYKLKDNMEDFFLEVVGFELRVLCLLGRCSTS
jgi:hypothetical protein